jgi:MscS family membrane protein
MLPSLEDAIRRVLITLQLPALLIPLLLCCLAAPALAQEAGPAVSESTEHLEGELAYGFLLDLLPSPFFKIVFLRIQLWQWIGLLLMSLVAYLVSLVVVSVVTRSLRGLVERTKTAVDDELLAGSRHPTRFLFTVIFFSIGSRLLLLSPEALETLYDLERGLFIAAGCWILFWVVNAYSRVLTIRLAEEQRKATLSLVVMGRRAMKVALLGLALITILHNIGFQVTSLIAGLGIGGLALALASQKTLENLLGGVMVVADQPVRVGDFCKFGDKMGTVEDLGIRSTRIRTLDRTVISVPNAEFSALQIENFGVRDRVRLITTIGLRYETSPDQLRWVLAELRRLLISHPMVSNDPARIRFIGFGSCSLDLEVFAYVLTADWNEFLAVREDIFLRIMDVVAKSGTGFAFPSQTAYLGKDSGLDAEKTAAAEAEVAQWRTERRVPFPAMSEGEIAGITDTLKWPPEDGVVSSD